MYGWIDMNETDTSMRSGTGVLLWLLSMETLRFSQCFIHRCGVGVRHWMIILLLKFVIP